MSEDPFKAIVRDLDNRIVAHGGRSLYGVPWLEKPTLGVSFYSCSVRKAIDDHRIIVPPRKYDNGRGDG